MDIKEKNLIQEAFEIEADEIGFCLDQKWGDYENPYENSDTALAFDLFKKGWLAKSQVPDGFVIVPKIATKSMAHAGKAIDGRLSAFKCGDIYKAMIEASQEQTHE
ncbi:hypothetical protein [Acinetobacter gerneri]|jgi:hypothetical protein|uniref:hypothetical protein n=1 Tax=Acinetobacter gerneri TaxID=202952 RepID=UPI0023F3BF05|nr:hypothetical protein [Acinetobacter gerneri]MCH4245665.1 hypothetical protein [Acinetobacter gerneri]